MKFYHWVIIIGFIFRGVGKGGRGDDAPFLGGKFYTFPKQSLREEISAKRTFVKTPI